MPCDLIYSVLILVYRSDLLLHTIKGALHQRRSTLNPGQV